jgi:hypothetical protein
MVSVQTETPLVMASGVRVDLALALALFAQAQAARTYSLHHPLMQRKAN